MKDEKEKDCICNKVSSKTPKEAVKFKQRQGEGPSKTHQLVLRGEVRSVVAVHRDRPCGFGFVFSPFGAKIAVESRVDVAPKTEWLKDVKSVISFAHAK